MDGEIKVWLSKTGYPLELFVHKIALSKGYLCEKSQIYSDAESGIAREIDLTAYNDGMCTDDYSYDIQLLLECKKTDKPLLVLCANNSLCERYEHFLGHEFVSNNPAGFFGYVHLRELSRERRLERIGRFADVVYCGYSAIPAFSKSDENIYKGVMGLASANEYYRTRHNEFCRQASGENTTSLTDKNLFQLLMPILVVDAPLYNAYLTEAGETNLQETDWTSLLVGLPWVLGKSDEDRRCNIQIVKKTALGDFFDSVGQLHKYISQPAVVSDAVIRITSKSTWTQKSTTFLRQLLRRS